MRVMRFCVSNLYFTATDLLRKQYENIIEDL